MGYYDSISNGYDELYREEQLNKIKIIKNSIRINKKTKLLDVGCGTGISSDFDCFVIGIDPSTALLNQNKTGFKVLGAAEDIPFKANSFDYVISVTAVHNFKNIKKSISEMRRVGRKHFVFSILKKSKKLDYIRRTIETKFKIGGIVKGEKDIIFFCTKP